MKHETNFFKAISTIKYNPKLRNKIQYLKAKVVSYSLWVALGCTGRFKQII